MAAPLRKLEKRLNTNAIFDWNQVVKRLLESRTLSSEFARLPNKCEESTTTTRHDDGATTIHEQICSDDEVGLVRDQECHRVGKVIRNTGPVSEIDDRPARVKIILTNR